MTLTENLNQTAAILEKLATKTQDQFITLGERMMAIDGEGKSLVEVLNQLEQLFRKQTYTGIIRGLELSNDQMKEYLNRFEREWQRVARVLEDTADILNRIRKPVSMLPKRIKTLRMMSLASRIESARAGLAYFDFADVTKSINSLAQQVEHKAQTIETRSEQLTMIIRDTIIAINVFRHQTQTQLVGITKIIEDTIDYISRLDQLADNVEMIKMMLQTEMSHKVHDIIVAMQYHDISSQRMTHVIESMHFAVQRVGDVADLDSRLFDREHAKECAMISKVLNLQQGHLEDVREEFAGAIERILQTLNGLGNDIKRMISESQATIGAADKEGSTFLDRLEGLLDSIVGNIRHTTETHKSLTVATGSASGIIEEIMIAAQEINTMGVDIQVTAQNAGIQAFHAGGSGGSIRVVTEQIKRWSEDTLNSIRGVPQMLEKLSTDARSLISHNEEEESYKSSIFKRMLEGFQDHSTRLRQIKLKSNTLVARMQDKLQSVSLELSDQLSRAHVQHEVKFSLTTTIRRLIDLNQLASRVLDIEHVKLEPDALRALEDLYTMAKERFKHDEVLAEVLESPEIADTDDDLGDNIELFAAAG